MRRLTLLLSVLVACCAAGASSSATALVAVTGGGVAPSATAAPHASTSPTVTKLLVVVEENHSLASMKSQMPYTFGLAQRYGYATDYHAMRHPSLPNYIAIAGGQMYGVTDDKPPAAHQLTGMSVFGQARHQRESARVYAQDMPSPCSLTNSTGYAVRHNPWTYFVNNRVGCRAADQPYSTFAPDVSAGRLPRVGMVVPNLCNDAHDCGLATADAFFKKMMTTVFAGPDWKAGRLAVVLTADEDDRTSGNVVLTTVIHPSQSHHVVSTPLNHYSLTRLYDEVARLPKLNQAATANSMATAFGLPVG